MTETDRTNFRGFCVPATELNTLCGCACTVTSVVSNSFHRPPGSSVDGIFLTRILEWVAILSSRGSSWPKDRTHTWISCIAGFFTTESSGKPQSLWVVRITEVFFFFQQRNDLVRIELWINYYWYFAKSGPKTQSCRQKDWWGGGYRSPVREQCYPDYGTGSCKGGNESRDTENLESEGCVDLA